MARIIELLLLESVENLGIVGDMVKVRPGYARNYLLSHGLGEFPTPEKIESLREARAKAMAQVAAERASREALLGRMVDVTITVQRSCNDQGVLYGSIAQRDIADALHAAGYGVELRAIRLSGAIRRVGTYHVPIQLDRDLKSEITLNVQADRQLEAEMRATEQAATAETSPAGEEGDDAAGGERKGGERSGGKPRGERPERGDRPERGSRKS